jgi:DNA-binding transcriptional regulator YiaG
MNKRFRRVLVELFTRADRMTRHEYRALRKSIGTQQAVAARLGVAPSTLQRRESGQLRIHRVAALAMLYYAGKRD